MAKLTLPAFIAWSKDKNNAQHVTAVTEYLESLEDTKQFLHILEYFELDQYTYVQDDEACYHTFRLSAIDDNQANGQDIEHSIMGLGDDMDPMPMYTLHLNNLYITIIGLA